MRIIKVITLMTALLIIATSAHAVRTALDQHCGKEYRKTGRCLEEMCQKRCYGGLDYPGCELECFGRDCASISVGQCPMPTCQVVNGCDGRKRCLPDEYDTDAECGQLGYVGDKIPCCDGLIKKCGIPIFDGTCDMSMERSIYAAPMCLPCGNGVCDTLENRCNCPEDCVD